MNAVPPLIELGVFLALTVLIESLVAGALGMRGRGLRAIALVNVVTNPVMNVVVLGLKGVAGWGLMILRQDVAVGVWIQGSFFVVLFLLEVVVVWVEWRLLVWALGPTTGTRRKLLATSIAMNLASAAVGPGSWFAVAMAISVLRR